MKLQPQFTESSRLAFLKPQTRQMSKAQFLKPCAIFKKKTASFHASQDTWLRQWNALGIKIIWSAAQLLLIKLCSLTTCLRSLEKLRLSGISIFMITDNQRILETLMPRNVGQQKPAGKDFWLAKNSTERKFFGYKNLAEKLQLGILIYRFQYITCARKTRQQAQPVDFRSDD